MDKRTFPGSNKSRGGITISSMTTNKDFTFLENNVHKFSPSIGLDWLGSKYFYLSSVAGWQRLGGKSDVLDSDDDNVVNLERHWDFLHLNTTARFRYPLEGINVYAGAGLYTNCLLGNRDMRDDYLGEGQSFHTNRFNFGELVEIGATMEQGRFRIELNASYQIHNNHITKFGLTKFYGDAWNVGLSVGYLLKK